VPRDEVFIADCNNLNSQYHIQQKRKKDVREVRSKKKKAHTGAPVKRKQITTWKPRNVPGLHSKTKILKGFDTRGLDSYYYSRPPVSVSE